LAIIFPLLLSRLTHRAIQLAEFFATHALLSPICRVARLIGSSVGEAPE
jgi:hypothetical protein